MEFLLIIFALVLGVLFFLNLKNTATILCRIVGGFAFLFVYNRIAPFLGLPSVGINFLSSAICGFLGISGGLLLLLLNL